MADDTAAKPGELDLKFGKPQRNLAACGDIVEDRSALGITFTWSAGDLAGTNGTSVLTRLRADSRGMGTQPGVRCTSCRQESNLTLSKNPSLGMPCKQGKVISPRRLRRRHQRIQ